MHEGDLATTPLPEILRLLADQSVTGCLRVIAEDGRRSWVYLRDGRVYAATQAGRHTRLGARLVTMGVLSSEDLDDALEVQRDELQGWRLGELLVHLGYADQTIVAGVVTDQLTETLAELLTWTSGQWRFRRGQRTREDVAEPAPVVDLLTEATRRHDELAARRSAPEPSAVPRLVDPSAPREDAISQLPTEAAMLLGAIDGRRSLAELGRALGLGWYEMVRFTEELIALGLIDCERVATAQPAAKTAPRGVPEPRSSPEPARPAVAAAAARDSAVGHPPGGAEDLRSAAALLAELSRTEAPAESEPAPAEPPVDEPESASDRPPARGDADTAALLRELSFLGVDDPPADRAADRPPAPPTRPYQPAAAQQRKRKGLFGR